MSYPNTIDIEETLLRLEQDLEDIVAQVTTLSQTMGDALQLRGSRIGGTAGQYVRKSSSTDHDYDWATIIIAEVDGLQDALDDLTEEDVRLAGLIAQRVTFVQTADTPVSRGVFYSDGFMVFFTQQSGYAYYYGDAHNLTREVAGWVLRTSGGSIVATNASVESVLIPPTTGWTVGELENQALDLDYYEGTPGTPGTVWIGPTQVYYCTDTNVWRSTGVLTISPPAHV